MTDIIIPVYNAYEDLMRCVESVKKHTALGDGARLVLIDDKSPDPRVAPYLNGQRAPGVEVLFNGENQGFSGTVNRGLSLSQNDVVLLNSDTEVTPRWLEKLRDCAYSEAAIGTVTPLSNNGSICSVPRFFEENALPAGFDIDSFARLVERTALHLNWRLPVGVGYCMFIKRAVIADVGEFDAAAFGRGYGEENDFCYRASELGYLHVCCDDTFIFHRGSASFLGQEKSALMQKNELVLQERYPRLVQETQVFLQPAKRPIQENLCCYLPAHNGKKNLLFFLHRDFRPGAYKSVGGVQFHVKDLVAALREDYNCFVLAGEKHEMVLSQYTEDGVRLYGFPALMETPAVRFRDERMAKIIRQVLAAFSIDLVHVHHTYEMTLDIFYEAERLGIPLVLSLHDYYYMCPTLQLLSAWGDYCGGPSRAGGRCRDCLRQRDGAWADLQPKWKRETEKVFSLCRALVAPDESVAGLYAREFPGSAEKLRVIAHGMRLGSLHKVERVRHTGFRVAFIGGMRPLKGSKVAVEMIKENRLPQVHWEVLGILEDEELAALPGVYRHGRYERDALGEILQQRQIDLVCLPSVCPETFCYTLSEALVCGLPVLAFDLGALGSRIRRSGCGWLVPPEEGAAGMLRALEAIAGGSEEYEAVRAKAAAYRHRTLEEMVAECRSLYAGLWPEERPQAPFSPPFVFEGWCRANGPVGPYGLAATASQERALEEELMAIKASGAYALARRLWGLQFPGRGKLAALVRKARRRQ